MLREDLEGAAHSLPENAERSHLPLLRNLPTTRQMEGALELLPFAIDTVAWRLIDDVPSYSHQALHTVIYLFVLRLSADCPEYRRRLSSPKDSILPGGPGKCA